MSTDPEYNTPYCRLCSHQLKATSGCATCLPVKRVLIWPALQPEADAAVTAKEMTQRTARLLKRQVRKLEALERNTDSFSPEVAHEIQRMARVIKELSGEIRKLEDRESAEYGAMSYQQRVQLFVDHFVSVLPEEHQRDLLALMERVIEKQAAPLPELPQHEG